MILSNFFKKLSDRCEQPTFFAFNETFTSNEAAEISSLNITTDEPVLKIPSKYKNLRKLNLSGKVQFSMKIDNKQNLRNHRKDLSHLIPRTSGLGSH